MIGKQLSAVDEVQADIILCFLIADETVHCALNDFVKVLDANNELPQMKNIYEEYKSQILCGCS